MVKSVAVRRGVERFVHLVRDFSFSLRYNPWHAGRDCLPGAPTERGPTELVGPVDWVPPRLEPSSFVSRPFGTMGLAQWPGAVQELCCPESFERAGGSRADRLACTKTKYAPSSA